MALRRSAPAGFEPARREAVWYLAREHDLLEPLLKLVPGQGSAAPQIFTLMDGYSIPRRAAAITQWLRYPGDWEASALEQAMDFAVALAESEEAEHADHGRALLEAVADKCDKMLRRAVADKQDHLSIAAMKLSLAVERHPGLASANVLGALASLLNDIDVVSHMPETHVSIDYRSRVDTSIKRTWDVIDAQRADVRRGTLHQLFRRKHQRLAGSMRSYTDDWSEASVSRAARTAASLRWHVAGILSYLLDAESWRLWYQPSRFGEAERMLAQAILASGDADFRAVAPQIFSHWRRPQDTREAVSWADAVGAIKDRMLSPPGQRA